MLNEGGHRYCPCYCEENVWHLCGEPALAGRAAQAVFISNPPRQVALRSQRQAPSPRLPMVWDYHVVLLAGGADGWEFWDLDSALGCPAAAADYLGSTFPDVGAPPDYAPLFRLIPAEVYRRELRSDRRHMRRADGTYTSPPPSWPVIGTGSNLMRFVDMAVDSPGEVLDLDGLRQRLTFTPHERRPTSCRRARPRGAEPRRPP